jgi:hypothetical protein
MKSKNELGHMFNKPYFDFEFFKLYCLKLNIYGVAPFNLSLDAAALFIVSPGLRLNGTKDYFMFPGILRKDVSSPELPPISFSKLIF